MVGRTGDLARRVVPYCAGVRRGCSPCVGRHCCYRAAAAVAATVTPSQTSIAGSAAMLAAVGATLRDADVEPGVAAAAGPTTTPRRNAANAVLANLVPAQPSGAGSGGLGAGIDAADDGVVGSARKRLRGGDVDVGNGVGNAGQVTATRVCHAFTMAVLVVTLRSWHEAGAGGGVWGAGPLCR